MCNTFTRLKQIEIFHFCMHLYQKEDMNTTTILEYLQLLRENNNREWFHTNKNLYTAARSSFEKMVETLIKSVYIFDQSIGFMEPKDCMFRINRDVRFSADKSPYKTNFGTFIAKGGKNGGKAGYYFHMEPGGSFVGGGIYMPDNLTLKAIRSEIHYDPESFLEAVQHPEFKSTFGGLSEEDILKKGPKDFPADFEHIDLLKYKSYVVTRSYYDKEVNATGFVGKIEENFRAMHPLVAFLNNAIENYGKD
jgi:uncharacterized protein (TIGR02453 family)